MNGKKFAYRIGKAAMACMVCTTLAVSPALAVAATSTEIKQEMVSVQEQYASLMVEAEQRQYELIDLSASLTQTEERIAELDVQIADNEVALANAQKELADVVAESYKNGRVSLVDVILSASSFDNLMSRITYANKMAEHEREAIDNVKAIQDELNAQRQQLEADKVEKSALVTERAQQYLAVRDAAASVESYYNQLSEEYKAQIAAEEAAARQAAMEQARAQAAAIQAAQEQAAREAAAQQAAQEQAVQEQRAAQEQMTVQAAPEQAAAPAAEATDNTTETQKPVVDEVENTVPAPAEDVDETAPAPADEMGQENTTPEPAQVEEDAEPEPEPAPAQVEEDAEPEPEPAPAQVEEDAAPEPEPEPEPAQVEEDAAPEEPAYEEEEEEYSAPSAVSSDIVANAYSILGAGYQWSGYNWTGDTGSSSFTCSGVIDYALGLPTNSNSPETLYSQVSNMVMDTSALSYGDLVFYSYAGRYPGHVGIYIGNGQIIDSIPNGGVAIRDVDYMPFIGGGSI